MGAGWIIITVTVLCALSLFAVAYIGERRNLSNNALVYTLSLAVFCTAWTFYGSVGRAATSGIGFLPIYLGPTLVAILFPLLLRKMIRITKVNRITSIADFIASRYGKSTLLAGLVTIMAVVGTVPYISLQLKAIATSFEVLWESAVGPISSSPNFLANTGLVVALLLALFAILFGTRHADVTEHNSGLVLAIAFEAVFKLAAFLAVGLYVTFGLYEGFGDLFAPERLNLDQQQLLQFEAAGSYGDWGWLIFLSMMAILFLPRQFQISVLENTSERHLFKAMWAFPLYLLLINLFVLPIAFAGLQQQPTADADFYVLSLPLANDQLGLALLVYVGGLFAATGMVIVATVTLSTMISNDLIVPILLRWPRMGLANRPNLSPILLSIRRLAILAILLLAYGYYVAAGRVSLVSIGLISFAAVAQFAPALLGGIYWKRGNRLGAIAGLLSGFLIWAYTLPLPSLEQLGGLSLTFTAAGPFGIDWLRPYALFGSTIENPVTHSLVWSLVTNTLVYITLSLLSTQTIREHAQSSRFVDVFERSEELDQLMIWGQTPTVGMLQRLLHRFLGERRAETALKEWEGATDSSLQAVDDAPPSLVNHVEKVLASAIGSASAHVVIASMLTEASLTMDEVINLLEETSKVYRYSQRLEQQSRELEKRTAELRVANERLKELDQMKSDFVSHVTHELRTPLTSIRAFSEILSENGDLDLAQRREFLGIIRGESERLTRLINNVLDLSKIESGNAEWLLSDVDLIEVVKESFALVEQLFVDKGIKTELLLPPAVPTLRADRDRLVQVMLNLLSNAIKFCDEEKGRVSITLTATINTLTVSVGDNGPGIDEKDADLIFAEFQQVRNVTRGKPQGTGLGLPISRHIIEHFGGRLWVESEPGQGATFKFELPVLREQPPPELNPLQAWSV
ncbi:MAG: sensor histidine kinase [Ardenticatenaceae bacterium]|nr:sensor histidine kinase [Ardenticatenaceae bacterium]